MEILFRFNNKATQPEGKMRTTISHFFLSDLFKTGKLGDKDFPLKALWVFSTNPLAGSPGTKVLTEEIWPNFDFVVVSDLVMTDTAKQADLVLPVPHFFEQEDVHTSGEHGSFFGRRRRSTLFTRQRPIPKSSGYLLRKWEWGINFP